MMGLLLLLLIRAQFPEFNFVEKLVKPNTPSAQSTMTLYALPNKSKTLLSQGSIFSDINEAAVAGIVTSSAVSSTTTGETPAMKNS